MIGDAGRAGHPHCRAQVGHRWRLAVLGDPLPRARDEAKELLFRVALMYPEIAIVWADSACAGKLVTSYAEASNVLW